MKETERNVREKLLEAGKHEFLIYGYEKASLRKICSRAGVTTGALYFFFENKADLFDAIVGEVVKQMQGVTKKMIAKELDDLSVGIDNERYLVEFLWKNREVVQIILEKSQGTKYEKIWEQSLLEMEGVYEQFFKKYGSSEPDGALIHILAKMKMQGYMELIMGEYSLKEALNLAEKVGWYAEGGFERLMEKTSQEAGCLGER